MWVSDHCQQQDTTLAQTTVPWMRLEHAWQLCVLNKTQQVLSLVLWTTTCKHLRNPLNQLKKRDGHRGAPMVAMQSRLPCSSIQHVARPLHEASKPHNSGRAKPRSIWAQTLSSALRRRLGSFEAALGSTPSQRVMCLLAYVAADLPLNPWPSKTPAQCAFVASQGAALARTSHANKQIKDRCLVHCKLGMGVIPLLPASADCSGD